MRLSFSNIAWDIAEDTAIAALLQKHGVDAIDIAPGKYFPDPVQASSQDIYRVKDWWKDSGIEIIGMQALLFGTTGLNVFGSPNVQDALLTHLEGVCRIGGIMGAKRLTFGSPKNRDRSGLEDDQVLEISSLFFRRLGDIAQRHGVIFCLEPNPVSYGANFMVTTPETAHVVESVRHAAIRMQFDTGALSMNGEDAAVILGECAGLVGHIHLSEPDLKPLGDCGTDHAAIQPALAKFIPELPGTIEMVATREENHLDSIERALKHAIRNYRPEKEVFS